MNFDEIINKVESSKEIPTIGPTASEVMRLAGDPESDFSQVGTLISQDPSLTARVLKIANSPYLGLRGEVATVDRAVGLLGLGEIRNIALSVSVINDFSTNFGGKAFNWERFWEHSSGCALIAKLFVNLLKLPTGGHEYVAGLLHDVGKILLGHHFPEEFSKALEFALTKGVSMAAAENHIFGADHTKLGVWLAKKWNFPESIQTAIAFHHNPAEAPGDGRTLAAVVSLADTMTKAKCIGFGGDYIASSITEDPAWEVIAEAKPSLETLDVERFTFQLDREVEAARELIKTART